MSELYFCLYLTENEHDIVEHDLREVAKNLNLEVKYYRQCKDGHVPMYREVKVAGEKANLFKKWMREDGLYKHIKRNPYSEE